LPHIICQKTRNGKKQNTNDSQLTGLKTSHHLIQQARCGIHKDPRPFSKGLFVNPNNLSLHLLQSINLQDDKCTELMPRMQTRDDVCPRIELIPDVSCNNWWGSKEGFPLLVYLSIQVDCSPTVGLSQHVWAWGHSLDVIWRYFHGNKNENLNVDFFFCEMGKPSLSLMLLCGSFIQPSFYF
jgi:hypothetical protein